MRQLAHAAVIDNQKGHGGQVGEIYLAGAIDGGVGEFLHRRVGFPIKHAVALLDHGAADGLSQVTLPRAWRVSYMMPIILRRSRSTIGGIRYMAIRCRCGGAHAVGTGTSSSAGSRMTPSVRSRRGCLSPPARSSASVRP